MDAADLPADYYATRPATVDCVIAAARRQRVPANVLLAIASVEAGRHGQVRANRDGSVDLGQFQINSVHLPRLARYGIRADDLRLRGCYAAELAGWMLANEVRRGGRGDWWSRAARYHSATPYYNAVYRSRLIAAADVWGRWLARHYPVEVAWAGVR